MGSAVAVTNARVKIWRPLERRHWDAWRAVVVARNTKSERLWLVAAIRQKLVPEFLGRGFEVATLSESDDDSADRSLISSFPFGLLRRKTARGFAQIKIELIS